MNDSKRMRLEAFSDGVMAIAITLLAIELEVPHLVSTGLETSIRELTPLLPGILTFILSFVTIAIFWVNHHQLTQHIDRVGKRVVWMNMTFLLFQALIPFATSVVAQNPANALSLLTFSAVLFGGSVTFTILRFFIHRKEPLLGRSFTRSLVGPIFYGLAIISIFFLPSFSTYIFLVIPPLYYFFPREVK